MNLSLDAIEALDAIIRCGSFAAAARELHKTQSAISYSIQQLEAQLELQLFDRSGHRAQITPAGRRILDEGRRLLADAQRLQSVSELLREGFEPNLQVVIDGILPQHRIMRALKTLADEDVPTQIKLKVEFLAGVQYRFERDHADLMLVHQYQPHESLEVQPLPELEAILVAAKEHPLANQSHLTLADLRAQVELSVHDSSEAADPQDTTAFHGPRVFYLSDFAAKLQALRLGLGYGWLPLYLAQHDLDRGDLTELPYERGSRYLIRPFLVHRRDRPLGKTAQRFVELLLPPSTGRSEATQSSLAK